MASVIVKNYANAIFDIAKNKDKVVCFKDELTLVKQVYLDNKDLVNVMLHPEVIKESKKNIIGQIFKVDKDLLSFLKVLVENDRFAHLIDICDEYVKLANNDLNIESVVVETAIKLDEKQINNIKSMLEKRLNKTIELNEVIKPSCLAGIRIVLKDEVLDNTIDTKLNKMRSSISNN